METISMVTQLVKGRARIGNWASFLLFQSPFNLLQSFGFMNHFFFFVKHRPPEEESETLSINITEFFIDPDGKSQVEWSSCKYMNTCESLETTVLSEKPHLLP